MQRSNNIDGTVRHTFKKYERLKHQKDIDTLFSIGKAYSVFPISIKYLLVPRPDSETAPVKAGFSVPKKKFRHAVKRNRVRRLMREAWRLNKHIINTIPPEKQLHVFFIYQTTELLKYEMIETAVLNCIQKLKTLTA